MAETIKSVLMNRDGMSEEDAIQAVKDARVEIAEMVSEGCSLCEVEDFIQDEFGLEPDYLMELL